MRPTKRGIDIVAFAGRRLWSHVIMLRSLSRASHVGILCEHDGVEYVIESLEGVGVRLVPFKRWKEWKGRISTYSIEGIFDEQRQAMIDEGMKLLGLQYASPWQFLRSFGFASRALMRRLGMRKDIETNRFFCSELVAHLIHKADIKLPKSPVEMTPGDVVSLPFVRPVVERVK